MQEVLGHEQDRATVSRLTQDLQEALQVNAFTLASLPYPTSLLPSSVSGNDSFPCSGLRAASRHLPLLLGAHPGSVSA